MKRRLWRLRIRFHDWMWDQTPTRRVPRLRQVCWKLPVYFSDPYYMNPRQLARVWAPSATVTVAGLPTVTMQGVSGVRSQPMDTTAMGSTVTFRFNAFRNPEEG